ncbi:MAG: hypothetical protein JO244_08225 [Solirubrobacterales bacterium]|nr:hypothetical protein [Solirubrobacterales bacterium]
MVASRCVVAVIVATSLAACGGSHRRLNSAGSQPASHVVAPSALALVLPISTAGPTTCTVYESGFATEVVFDSQSLNVTGECQAWTSRQPGSGYLWDYQPTDAAIGASAVSECNLKDPSGRVTAIVVEDTGFAPISAIERVKGATACSSLASAGWVRSLG